MNRFFACLIILFAACLWTPGVAISQDKIVYKGATVAPKPSPWEKLLKRYRKSVKKKSGKQIKTKLFFGTKGDEQSLVRQVRKGDLQFAGVSTGALSVVAPEIDILELPYLFDSFEEADRILVAVQPIVEEILEKKGFKLIMYSENGYRCFGTNKPVRKPSDMKGMTMRSQESPSHLAMYKSLGAFGRSMAVSEVLPNLNTGNVSGFDNTALFTQAASWQQAIKYFTLSEHIYQPALLIVNKKWYDGLSPELQKAVINDDLIKLAKKGLKAIRALNPMVIENFKMSEVEVITLSAEEKAAFKKATRPAWKARMSKATKDGKRLFDAIMKAKKQ